MAESWTYMMKFPSDVPSHDKDGVYAREPIQEDCSHGTIPAEAGRDDGTLADGTRKILVPELKSMTKHLFDNYRLTMFSYLNKCLKSGRLAGIVGFKFSNRILNKDSCKFLHVSYWKIDRENFFADVEVKLILHENGAGASGGVREWTGYLCLWFNVENGFTCQVEDFNATSVGAESGLVMLDKYLIPYYTNQMVDRESEKLWEKYYKPALYNPRLRQAAVLADKMGLTIVPLPVYQHNGIGSMIFFKEGPLLVKEEGPQDESEPHEVTVSANTIVINTNLIKMDYSAFDIFHECFHFEHHYMFFKLQEMYNNV